MKLPTYKDKTFIVSDGDARVRQADNLLAEEKYKAGDEIPQGCAVGDVKRIPKGAEVKILDLKTAGDRLAFVLVEPVNAGFPPAWTRASNLEGGLLNELVSFAPGDWDFPPCAENYTVTDKQAIIRGGAPGFASTGKTIPVGAYVVVTDRAQSGDRSFVKVSKAVIENGEIKAGEAIGWTSAANLTDGCTRVFGGAEWTNQKGANACWQKGEFKGAKVLVNIVGTGSQIEQITLETLPAYLALKDAAAEAGLTLAINSGFRTFAHQDILHKIFLKNKKPVAARAGRSNHQHGKAFDLNTGGFDGDPIYNWLKKNATSFGFVRTVSDEHWHWEPLPEIAAKLKKTGEFKICKGK